MYTLATIFIFSVIGLSIYFQLTKNKKFKIIPNNKDLVKIFTKTNPSLLYPILFLSIHFLIMFLGKATNSLFIAMLVGGIGSLAFDPLIMLISLISGSVYKDFKKSISCILSTAFIVCIVASTIAGGGAWIFFCRFEAMLLLSSLGMLGRTSWEMRAKPN